MSDPNIDSALTSAYVVGGFDSTPTEYPNREFKPVAGKDWNQIHLMPSESEQASLGVAGSDKESGSFQITLNTPKYSGDGDILDRARAIKSHYQQNNTLSYNGITVNISTITIHAGFISENWYKVPVRINYNAYLQRG